MAAMKSPPPDAEWCPMSGLGAGTMGAWHRCPECHALVKLDRRAALRFRGRSELTFYDWPEHWRRVRETP